jgi:predicted RecB family nuclease
MQLVGKSLHLSASDLVGHLNCRYLTMLDLQVAYGKVSKPKVWDPLLELLVERGALHEQAYVDHLRAEGLSITKIEGVGVDAGAVAQTVAAMKTGTQVIVQGALQSANWAGRTDILRRVETPSAFGAWSYEVTDTKLARETKGNAVLQLCLYSNLLATTQNLTPAFAYVVTPETGFAPEPYRLADYAAYYRHVRRSLEVAVVSEPAADMYPEPIIHCDICRWRRQCDAKRRADDHLSLVAGISKSQMDELKNRAVETMEKLAAIRTRCACLTPACGAWIMWTPSFVTSSRGNGHGGT